MTILEIKDLHASYGNIRAVRGVDVHIEKGWIAALLGSNGAGKTTMLKAVSGLIQPDRGQILMEGHQIQSLTPNRINRMGIVQAPEGRQIFPELTVEENLRIGAFTVKSRGQVRKNLDRVYGYFPVLKERTGQIAGTLSGGEQQMLAIARALMANPKILLLDEPSLGLAPMIVRSIFQIVKDINSEGTTVLIVEQNALQTLKIADYAYVLEVGKIHSEGSARDLIQDKNLIDAYLGGH